jgi:hypothetical protein
MVTAGDAHAVEIAMAGAAGDAAVASGSEDAVGDVDHDLMQTKA